MPEICLAVIAKNEERQIQRCLTSAKNLVDRMVVFDTGSTDNTIKIAKATGAAVYEGIWKESFAEARNSCMVYAASDWCLILDADEWIDPRMDRSLLDRHIHSAGRFKAAGSVRIRNRIFMEGREEFADTWIPRLLPGTTRYVGSIHEQPITTSPDCRIDFLIHHDGYSRDQCRYKSKRNLGLLEKSLSQTPNSPYINFQLGVEYEKSYDYPKALIHFIRSREMGGCKMSFGHGLSFRLIHALARSNRFAEALDFALAAQELWPESSDIFFALGNVCLDAALANPESAVQVWLPAAERAWIKCLEIGDSSPYADHVIGRGSHLAAHNLAVLYKGLGRMVDESALCLPHSDTIPLDKLYFGAR